MYCPNCSTEASTDQKFCRSCGMDLQAVAALVSGQTNIAQAEKPREGVFQGRQRGMLIWGMILTFGAVALGASLKILGKEHIQVAGDFTPYLNVIVMLIAFFGMGLMSYPFLHMVSPSRKSQRASSPKLDPTARLQPRLLPEEPSSVTEQTTEFLEGAKAPVKALDTAPHTD